MTQQSGFCRPHYYLKFKISFSLPARAHHQGIPKNNRTFTFANWKSSDPQTQTSWSSIQRASNYRWRLPAPKRLFLHTFLGVAWTLILIAHVQLNHTLWLYKYRDLTCVYDGGTSHNPAPSWFHLGWGVGWGWRCGCGCGCGELVSPNPTHSSIADPSAVYLSHSEWVLYAGA